MQSDTIPRSGLARWLVAPGSGVGPDVADHLESGLYGSLPIFLGGVINSIVIATVAAVRHPTALFFWWVAIEVVIGICRLGVVTAGNRARRSGRPTPTNIAILLACAWAASVGFGTYISVASEDWVLATITCLSAAAMVSGICLRNFGTPRLVAIMMVLCLIPCAVAAIMVKESVFAVVSIQLPIYMVTIGAAAFRMNGMMVSRFTALDALAKSEAFNRSILESSPDYTLLLDEECRIIFCNRPQAAEPAPYTLVGLSWFDVLPPESHDEGRAGLERARAGEIARMTVANDEDSRRRWFDIALSLVADGSGRFVVVARDITHQKSSEEEALWMANHDPLTRLPNRVVLQGRLDGLPKTAREDEGCALLVLDVDNFKLINDTLGHDAGDALLCAFAERLTSAVRPGDLIARLGGDEFAIVLNARSEAEVNATAEKIFAALHLPVAHDGRLIECNASIGACLWPRDGAERSELMKCADMALYSAKAGGRGQLKIFQNAMRNEFQNRNSMIALARRALSSNDLLPYYQPKISLRGGEIIGFEALLRWRDTANRLQRPQKLMAAFDDPLLSTAISTRMIDCVLDDIRNWLDRGIAFGHVALNVSATDFRSGRFAESILEKLENYEIPSHCLQVEVTERVFLGRGSEYVGQALRRLRRAGVAVALDDFGTGYASLAHLMQFPVDALKIDKSFIRGIGKASEAEAITRAIVNLGHSLDVDIIAEGVETPEHEAYLIGLGCQIGQGYLYSKAIPAESVGQFLRQDLAKSA